MKENQIQAVIKEIDYELIARGPAMDDYEGGLIKGLRIAREIVSKRAKNKSDDSDFRYHTRVM